jgi:hypothetical protein
LELIAREASSRKWETTTDVSKRTPSFIYAPASLGDNPLQFVGFRRCQRTRSPVDNCFPFRLTDGSQTMNVVGSAIQPPLGDALSSSTMFSSLLITFNVALDGYRRKFATQSATCLGPSVPLSQLAQCRIAHSALKLSHAVSKPLSERAAANEAW